MSAPPLIVGVRHHSPAAARAVRELLREQRPATVLVEGPADFNARIGELALDHAPPIAIAASLVHDGRRRTAYHPFCRHSPEWIAVRDGLAAGAHVAFVDLPWGELVRAGLAGGDRDRYGGRLPRRGAALAPLLARLGVDDLDGAWDRLVEAELRLDAATYLARSDALWEVLRAAADRDDPALVAREREMVARVAEAVRRRPGPTLVVVGGLHAPALRAAFAEGAPDAGAAVTAAADAAAGASAADATDAADATIAAPAPAATLALTPYDDRRLSRDAGYGAALPSPGFHALAWAAHEREGGDASAAERLLAELRTRLTARGARIATADLVALSTAAAALAELRGHPQVWRADLADAVRGTLVTDELALGLPTPALDVLDELMRGSARGRLAADAPLPPLVHDLDERLARAGLTPEASAREVTLQLDAAADRDRSRLLHCVAALGLPGCERVDTAEAVATERWRLRRTADFEAAAIDAAGYGAQLEEAVAARLAERAVQLGRDAGAAAALLEQATRCGIDPLSARLSGVVRDALRTDGGAASVTRALWSLLDLHRRAPDDRFAALLATAAERLSELLDPDRGGAVAEGDGIAAVAALLECAERSGRPPVPAREPLLGALRRIAVARGGGRDAAVRGAALGALWRLDSADEVTAVIDPKGSPELLGDLLFGLFTLARDVIVRRPQLRAAVDTVVAGLDDDAFLVALPALRRAFSVFSPREKDALARALTAAPPAATFVPSAAAIDALAAIERQLDALVARSGVELP